jgi:hypothetical protein
VSDLVSKLSACRDTLDGQRYVTGLHVELLDWAIAELRRLAAIEERVINPPRAVMSFAPVDAPMAPPADTPEAQGT